MVQVVPSMSNGIGQKGKTQLHRLLNPRSTYETDYSNPHSYRDSLSRRICTPAPCVDDIICRTVLGFHGGSFRRLPSFWITPFRIPIQARGWSGVETVVISSVMMCRESMENYNQFSGERIGRYDVERN